MGTLQDKAKRLPRVLIADDNETIRRALRGMFTSSGHEWSVCGEAANGEEAVQLAANLKPDIVLLDFQMPVVNGLDAAREIGKNHPSLPVAMYTLHQNTMFEKQAQAYGVRKVISKTDVFSALIPSLAEMLKETDKISTELMPKVKQNRSSLRSDGKQD